MKAQKSLVLKYNSQQELFSALIRHHYTLKEQFTRIKSFLRSGLLKVNTALHSIL